jgi:phosphonate transport system ATP-binding protein
MFQLKDLRVAFKDHLVLDNISLHIKAGEKVALVGGSGAGKSTLLRHLYRLLPEKVALCPQALGLVPMLSTYHNIYIGSLSRRNSLVNIFNLIKPVKAYVEEVKQVVEGLDIDEHLIFKPVRQLSGGQQQRTAIARALYQNSPVFIGDEPVSAVDELHGEQIMELILKKHETVICSLHDRELALKYFDRIIGLKNGVISLDSKTSDIDKEQLDHVYQS